MHKTKIIDSSHQNPGISLWCSFCSIESIPDKDTRRKGKLNPKNSSVEEIAVSIIPERGIQRKKSEITGTLKTLEQRGIRITHVTEHRKMRKEKQDGGT